MVGASSAHQRSDALVARLDRLPMSRYVVGLIVMLALGGAFELYDLTLTGTLVPALVRAGIFQADRRGVFGMADQASFASVTFAGLFIGTALFAPLGDRIGRRLTFAASLVWYTIFGVIMALQNSVAGIEAARFVAGIGIGVQLVTLDSYVAELAPKMHRGKAFAISQSIQFLGVPCAAIASAALLTRSPFGFDGWRWVAALPVLALVVAAAIYRFVPESPRWLADHGRIDEAEAVAAQIDRRASGAANGTPPRAHHGTESSVAPGGLGMMWQPPYRQRTVMLVVYNIFQAAGFFGFTNWVPTLLAAQGIAITKSLVYTGLIALLYPICPIVFTVFADRVERKWQLVIAAAGMAVFGLLFATQRSPGALIALGALVTLFGTLLSYSGHAYQSELYPTSIRARAVGLVYSFSRLSPIFTSFVIGALLRDFGATGVFVFIASSMGVVIAAVGVFGPRTSGLALEQISPAVPQAAGGMA